MVSCVIYITIDLCSLMANNPMLLLQILAYNVECIVKAFSEGMIEIAQNVQENEKVSAEKMLTCTSGNTLYNENNHY